MRSTIFLFCLGPSIAQLPEIFRNFSHFPASHPSPILRLKNPPMKANKTFLKNMKRSKHLYTIQIIFSIVGIKEKATNRSWQCQLTH